jgi:protein-S-isoprenylcysteine O-methyltransferase Ste14
MYVVVSGDVLVALGLLIVFLVFKENTFTSATIEVSTEQKVISTGPYALVRHPMYIGAFIMLIGVSLALGSWLGLLAVIPIAFVIIWRLLDEEKFLAKNLSGYAEYLSRVKYRLIPFVW